MLELFTRHGTAQKANGADAKGRPVWTHDTVCSRCGGPGRIDGYRHIDGGVCYKCFGHGRGPVVSERLYTAEEISKLDATAAKKAATKMAALQRKREREEAAREALRAERQAGLEADPFYQRLAGYVDRNEAGEFLNKMLDALRVYDLSPAQLDAATEAMDRIDAHKARIATAAFVGEVGQRIQVAGVVEFVRCIYEGDPMGYRDPSRYLIKIRTDEGQSLTWFTTSYAQEGERVIGTATVKDHSEFRGERQTIIKNPRWKEAA